MTTSRGTVADRRHNEVLRANAFRAITFILVYVFLSFLPVI
jgi:hypothetical protein